LRHRCYISINYVLAYKRYFYTFSCETWLTQTVTPLARSNKSLKWNVTFTGTWQYTRRNVWASKTFWTSTLLSGTYTSHVCLSTYCWHSQSSCPHVVISISKVCSYLQLATFCHVGYLNNLR